MKITDLRYPFHIVIVNRTLFFSEKPFEIEGIQSQTIDKTKILEITKNTNNDEKQNS